MSIKDFFKKLVGKKEPEPLKEIPPVSNDIPKHDLGSVKQALSTLEKQKVEILFAGDNDHSDGFVSAKLGQIMSEWKPDLLFVEGSRDLARKKVYEQYRADNNISDKTKIIPADLKESEKAIQRQHAKMLFGNITLLSNLEDYQLAPETGDNGKEEKRLYTEFYDMAASEIQRHSRALDDRFTAVNDGKVASYIADKIVEFYEKHHRMPKVCVTYGNTHFSNAHGIDEQVAARLAEKGYHINMASISVTPGDKDTEVKFTGRDKNGNGNDYDITVKKQIFDSKKAPTHLGVSTEAIPHAYMIREMSSDMSMNALITAFNKLDDAMASLMDDDKFEGHKDIPKVDKTHSIAEYLDEKKLEKLKDFADQIMEASAQQKFNSDSTTLRFNKKFAKEFEELSELVDLKAPQITRHEAKPEKEPAGRS